MNFNDEVFNLRDKKEFVNYFKENGVDLSENEIDEIRETYANPEFKNHLLNSDQLDKVAGGGGKGFFERFTGRKQKKDPPSLLTIPHKQGFNQFDAETLSDPKLSPEEKKDALAFVSTNTPSESLSTPVSDSPIHNGFASAPGTPLSNAIPDGSTHGRSASAPTTPIWQRKNLSFPDQQSLELASDFFKNVNELFPNLCEMYLNDKGKSGGLSDLVFDAAKSCGASTFDPYGKLNSMGSDELKLHLQAIYEKMQHR